jgi:hypothetical protein
MMIIGVDYHPSFQTIAFVMEETGECGERELHHSDGQAEKFYRDLKQRGICVRVGMEATGYSRWFERLLAELGFELWIGDPAEIKAKRIKKQKTDQGPVYRWGNVQVICLDPKTETILRARLPKDSIVNPKLIRDFYQEYKSSTVGDSVRNYDAGLPWYTGLKLAQESFNAANENHMIAVDNAVRDQLLAVV